MSVKDAWHTRPQLFVKCLLHPQNGRLPKNYTWVSGPDDIKAHLVFFSTFEVVFFSTFEELKLPANGPMDHATTKLY